MANHRNDYEPIIAERRPRHAVREDGPPVWRLALMLIAGLAILGALAWWFMGRSSVDGASATAPSQASAPEVFPEEQVEQEILPPAQGLETEADTDIAQAPKPAVPAAEPTASAEQPVTPESIPESVPDETGGAQAPPSPAQVSVRLMSPDPRVRFELRSLLESSPPVTSKAGDVVAVTPGTYRVIASGNQLETFEQDVTLDGERPLEYTVELCAERAQERESLAGRVVEERECASTAECESMFMVLSEEADHLVQDRAFRRQQCASWRANAEPEGRWRLDIRCGGATATTCRIEIGEGACTFAESRRSLRGSACPRAELN